MFGMMNDPWRFHEEAMTYNSHQYGLALDTFKSDEGLGKMFTPTSTSTNPDSGDTFVASMESKYYPFYATQFHPEKVLTQYNSDAIDHSWESTMDNRYLADRFIELARMNENTCGTFEECQDLIIDNTAVIVTDTYYGNVYAW
uniref:Glutamine amidotransferase domain-containing protein n=1 Tax=Favella ehrenbergii TaxID=182087 RepID=A0A7S3HY45_9SPIT|mmetsp:Transcript_17297/g.21824  ORF Transcript_17297/g.21824 Transcript_17297/m.21824 type:complete len:143 (+) Transcript_17297:553-981(+)